MRLANLDGRATLVDDRGAQDVERASGGRFGPGLQSVFTQWPAFVEWAAGAARANGTQPFEASQLGAPSPTPSQVFAIGLNYADHAAEAGLAKPDSPMVFTKFQSSITGPHERVHLPSATVDWEAELVVVIGTGGRDIAAADAWERVAGLTVGQDLSDRTMQTKDAPPQFSLGKSFAGFSPIGPWIVSPDELQDPDDLAISAVAVTADGERRTLQDGRTSDMVFSVAELVSSLSTVVELRPGDLVFTGTPAGVGMARDPAQYLEPGWRLETSIEGIGTITQELVGG